MVSLIPRHRNLRREAGGGAAFIVRGGYWTGSGWCPAFISLELGEYPSSAEISLASVTPEVLRAVADDLEARLALVPDEQVPNGDHHIRGR